MQSFSFNKVFSLWAYNFTEKSTSVFLSHFFKVIFSYNLSKPLHLYDITCFDNFFYILCFLFFYRIYFINNLALSHQRVMPLFLVISFQPSFLQDWTLNAWNEFAEAALRRCSQNKVEIALRHGWSPLNLLHIFTTPFRKNTYEGLLLNLSQCFHYSFSVTCLCHFIQFEKSYQL